MLILFWYFMTTTLIPTVGSYIRACVEPMLLIAIILGGIMLMFSAVGVRISANAGSTVIGGIFRAIGYVVRTIVAAVSWVIVGIFHTIPRVYTGTRNSCTQSGMAVGRASIIATIVTILFIIVII